MDAALWRDLLHPDVSILEKIIRPILVYFFLVISLRLAGKRELAQLNPFDLVVLLTLSNTVQNAIIGNDNSVTSPGFGYTSGTDILQATGNKLTTLGTPASGGETREFRWLDTSRPVLTSNTRAM